MSANYEAKASDLFKVVGENVIEAYNEAKRSDQDNMRMKSLTFSIEFFLSSDLERVRLASNHDLRLGGLKKQSAVKLKVTAR